MLHNFCKNKFFKRKFGGPIGKRRNKRGATAVEFALIATPFFFMVFALIELMVIFFMQTALESAVAMEARKIRTGQAQSSTAPISQTQFKTNICNRMMGMVDCTSRLFVSVEAFTSPPSNITNPWSDGNLVPGSASDEPYQMANAGDMVIVRSYYLWPLMTPGMTNALRNFSNGTYGSNNRILVAVSAFRTEPFQ
jgi:Flp pilus assembly protein TadG